MTTGILASRNLTATAQQPIYANTTSDAQWVNVNIVNRNNATITFSLAQADTLTTIKQSEWLEWGTSIVAYGTFERTGFWLAPSQYIVVQASSANVSVNVYGVSTGDSTAPVPTGIADTVANGSTQIQAATSALAIKALTGTTTDGVYWIKATPRAPAQQVYCIMDAAWDSGGWMIMANNAALGVVASSGHIPRLTSLVNYVGSNGANRYTPTLNFSNSAEGMNITKIAWCAWNTNWKTISTYIYGTFNSSKSIPASPVWTRRFDNYHQTLPWLTGSDIRTRPAYATDPTGSDLAAFSAIAGYDGLVGSGTFGQPVGYVNPTIMCRNNGSTTFPISDNDSNCYGVNGIFSFSANSLGPDAATASATGWDDWQDGNSLGDGWGTAATVNFSRGSASYIMVK